MIAQSTLTLQDIEDRFIALRDDDSIQAQDLVYAYRDFISFYQRQSRKFNQEDGLEQTSVSIPSTGLDLTAITPEIGTLSAGFKVYKGEVKQQNILDRVDQDSTRVGYSIRGNNIFLVNAQQSGAVIVYQRKTNKPAVGTALDQIPLEIPIDLEDALEEYIRITFYDGQYQFDLRSDAEQKVTIKMEEYFTEQTDTGIIFI